MQRLKDLNRRWQAGRVRLRERIYRRIPGIVFTNGFEIVAVSVAALMSIPSLVGLSTSAALIGLVGVVLFYGWALTLAFGAIALGAGLRRLNPALLASGLQLTGGSFAVYTIALVASGGWGGVIAGAAFIVLAVVAALRSLHFRRLFDIHEGAKHLEASP